MALPARDIQGHILPASLSSDDQLYILLAARFLKERGAKKVVVEVESCPPLLREQTLEHGIILHDEN